MQIEVIRDLEAVVFSTKRGDVHFTGVFAPYTTKTMILSRFFGSGVILYIDSDTIVKPTYKKEKENE